MVIRDNAKFRRFWRKIVPSGRQALVWLVCATSFSAWGALAVPHALPGQALQSWHEWAARPVIRAGLCTEDDEPCPAYEPNPNKTRPVHARRWEPEPYRYEERAVIPPKPDCVEERYAAHTHAVREIAVPRHSEETYEEPCGIRCWYKRLRAGYCGRGCDYYPVLRSGFLRSEERKDHRDAERRCIPEPHSGLLEQHGHDRRAEELLARWIVWRWQG